MLSWYTHLLWKREALVPCLSGSLSWLHGIFKASLQLRRKEQKWRKPQTTVDEIQDKRGFFSVYKELGTCSSSMKKKNQIFSPTLANCFLLYQITCIHPWSLSSSSTSPSSLEFHHFSTLLKQEHFLVLSFCNPIIYIHPFKLYLLLISRFLSNPYQENRKQHESETMKKIKPS